MDGNIHISWAAAWCDVCCMDGWYDMGLCTCTYICIIHIAASRISIPYYLLFTIILYTQGGTIVREVESQTTSHPCKAFILEPLL